MAEFTMPTLGADMDEGTLVEWLVKPGDQIHKGDIIAVVDTAKSAIEVESFHTGTVESLIVPAGQTVPVGTVLATITEARAAAGKPARPVPQPPVPSTPLVRHEAGQLGVDLATVAGTGPGGTITRADVEHAAAGPRPRITPLARRLAAELGVDPGTVHGTGPGGAVREADVRRAADTGTEAVQPAEAQSPATPAVPAGQRSRAERADSMRQAIARLMARSKREIPHYYVSNTVDLGTALNWLHERNRSLQMSERLVPAALLLRATALAARQVPELNGYWTDDHFVPGPAVHLGVAISLRGGGLITPAIHDADGLAPGELMAGLRDLVSRARAGRLRASELTDATITVTNLGDQGVESVTGVIYPPQVALVGFGKIVERPWAVGGLLGVRPVVVSTLAADHRATDGYTGGRFLTVIAELLQRPEEL